MHNQKGYREGDNLRWKAYLNNLLVGVVYAPNHNTALYRAEELYGEGVEIDEA